MANLFGFNYAGVSYAIPVASEQSKGLMSAEDFTKLGNIAAGAQVNVLEGIKVNGVALALAEKIADILIAEGSKNGTISVNNVDIAVHGLAALAYKAEVSKDELASALKTELEGKLDADNEAYTGALTAIATLIGTGADSVDGKITAAFNKFTTDVSNDGVVNTWKEFVDWVSTHGAEAVELAGTLSKVEGYLAGIGGEGEPATVMAAIQAAVTNLNMSNYYTKSEVDTELVKKVDKVEGYGLSKNDFTDALLAKLNGIDESANKTTFSYDETTGFITLGGMATV